MSLIRKPRITSISTRNPFQERNRLSLRWWRQNFGRHRRAGDLLLRHIRLQSRRPATVDKQPHPPSRTTNVHNPTLDKTTKPGDPRQRVGNIDPSRSMHPFKVKSLEEFIPPSHFPSQPGLIIQECERLVVRHQSEMTSLHITTKLPKGMYNGKHLLLTRIIVVRGIIEPLAFKSYRVPLLHQHRSDAMYTSVTNHFNRKCPIPHCQNRRIAKSLL